jgi:polysaccharide biosynthesis protein PslG
LKFRIFLLFLLCGLFILPVVEEPNPAHAASTVRYFPETGHYVSGAFWGYWEQNGGLEQFGYPLTEPFREMSTNGNYYVTQYFERAIFEYHPEHAATKYQVLLRLVGNIETQGRTFADAPTNRAPAGGMYFPETRQTLTGTFLNFWRSRGGLPVFGYPLSEPFRELNPADNKVYEVQYFERARLEYHPEFKGTRYEVLMGLLGWQQLVKSNVPQIAKDKRPGGQERALEAPIPNSPPTVRPELVQFGRSGSAAINPLKSDGIGYGMNVWLLGQDHERILGLVKDAGFGWIRQQIRWEEFEKVRGQINWTELDRTVDSLNRAGIKALFSVLASPGWAAEGGGHGLPTDVNTYANFVRQMAQRYKGRVAAYEIWNEQNLGLETNNRIEPGKYVELLKAAYRAIKAEDSGAIVVYGGLSPTGVIDKQYAVDDAIYLEQSYLYNNGEVRNYFDVMGVHPGSHGNSPDELWPADRPGRNWADHPSFFFRRVENMRDIMVGHGDGNKQIWLTEFGWTTTNAARGYEYGVYNDENRQAQNLVRSYQRAQQQYPWMGVMAVWQLNFAPIVAPTDEKAPWGLIRGDWSTRPSYNALKSMPKTSAVPAGR